MRAAIAVVLIAALSASPASPAAAADDNDALARARAHYEIGLGLYKLGDYSGAIREFSAGYQLSQRPKFLINLGQAHRKLEHLAEARRMYERYLAETPPDEPDRAQVQALLRGLGPAPPPAISSNPLPPATSFNEATPATSSNPAAPAIPSNAAPAAAVAVAPRPHGLKRWWWTIPLSLAAAGALGVGIYFGVRGGDNGCHADDLACLHVGH